MKPHKHAAVIHAWADGAEIEYQSEPGDRWYPYGQGDFSGRGEYRVKPEPVAKAYPRSNMSPTELAKIVNPDTPGIVHEQLIFTCARVANAAIRHAIEAEQLVDPITYAEEVREAAGRRNASRDMAIAEAVRQAAKLCACPVTSPEVFMRIEKLNLATIIANQD